MKKMGVNRCRGETRDGRDVYVKKQEDDVHERRHIEAMEKGDAREEGWSRGLRAGSLRFHPDYKIIRSSEQQLEAKRRRIPDASSC